MEPQVPADDGGPGDEDTSPEPDQDNERLTHFIHLLEDDEPINRIRAAEMLGRMGDPAAVDDLISALWDDDARVRLKVAWALGRIGSLRASAPLKRLYRMEDEWAQEIIRESLEAIRQNNS